MISLPFSFPCTMAKTFSVPFALMVDLALRNDFVAMSAL
jgi:hypothetical protein